jgi:hypothetical protein
MRTHYSDIRPRTLQPIGTVVSTTDRYRHSNFTLHSSFPG